MKFSIGYNHDMSMLDIVLKYKKNISDLYFPIPVEFLGSGRNIVQRNKYKKEIIMLIDFCNKHNISSNLLINPTCEGNLIGNQCHMNMVVEYVEKLYKKGLKSVTLVNPMYIKIIKQKIPKLKIQCSVNCNIDNIEKAKFYDDLGVSVIVIDRDINRNLDLIKKIKSKVKAKLKLMLNEGCFLNCITRNIHFNYTAHNTDGKEMNGRFCMDIIKKKPELFFKSPFVRPEDLKHYNSLIDEFKIVTRSQQTDKVELILKAYIDQKYDGNLLDLIDSEYPKTVFNYIDNKKLSNLDFFNKIIENQNENIYNDFYNLLFKNCCKFRIRKI
jgi:collagenase-like PrtC family protease